MRPGARIKAAADVIGDILKRHRPASAALSDWGKAHRFAGSGDRSAIGNLVYDALRRKQSLAARMGSETPRALALAAASEALGLSSGDIAAAADGSRYSIPPLSEEERKALESFLPETLPAYIRADLPQWIWPSFAQLFGDDAVRQGAALANRAPIDLRANTLKATREQVLEALAKFGAEPTRHAPHGIRIPPPEAGKRQPHVEAETSHGRGWFEVQDEGSQIAAAMSGAAPGMQVLDFCAGAGGKTLAMAAMMGNTGQITAYDRDKLQLRPIFERLTRAGVTNVAVADAGDSTGLAHLEERCDVVLVDAPCTGSGTWRRRPDSKWRLKEGNIAQRQADQRAVLKQAVRYVAPGGRLVYVTCSVLAAENTETVDWLASDLPNLEIVPYGTMWADTVGGPVPGSADGLTDTLLLTPASHDTDGFFIAAFRRSA